MIYLPRGKPVRENVNPARINLPEAMDKLRDGRFTGYLRFDAAAGTGVIIFENGKLISASFVDNGEGEHLIAYDAIARIFEMSISGDAQLNIFRVSTELSFALHALLHGKYIYRGQALKLIDIRALLERIKKEQMTGCLRVYAEQKTTLIFYDQGSARGFFHDGAGELQVTADLSRSVARLPDARIDLLETRNPSNLSLADLMASADLGPIWRRARSVLLQDRSKREEAAIRSLEERQELQRQRTLADLKAIAGKHIGKFGASQVEKAFLLVGPDMHPEEIGAFYRELERLAKLVAGPKKIAAMLDDMKTQIHL